MSGYISNLKGFKYPDAELIRYFFKNHLNTNPQKVLELGCNNGNNLALFASYDYEVIGVELNLQNVENANFNFTNVYGFDKFKFINQDMREFCKSAKGLKASILLIPNVINYITKSDFATLLTPKGNVETISDSNGRIYAVSLEGNTYIEMLGLRDTTGLYIAAADFEDEKLSDYEKNGINIANFIVESRKNYNK